MHLDSQKPQPRPLLIVGFCLAAAVPLLSASVSAQTLPAPSAEPIERPVITWGEVTASDVYVRSGDSMNHYTVCKLNSGDRVAIVGQRGDWYEILPPEGTFSLISGDYVDTSDDKSGVVNGENVRVRAGSTLNDNKYTVQTMLSRGARVTILGRNPDGFLRIKPPAGATLWINGDYVAPTTGDDLGMIGGRDAGQAGEQADPASEAPPASGVLGSPSVPGRKTETGAVTSSGTSWRKQLEEIDAAAKAEVAKPPAERRFDEIVERYRAVSEQKEDDYARQYALTRLDQVDNMTALAAAIERVQRLGAAADSRRREHLAARATIPDVSPPAASVIEIQGELRVSALYPPGSTVRRFRLIDPKGPHDRTIAYVEIPPDSPIQVDSFIGQFVGVRASQRRLQTGGVDAIPVYVARELILLEPPAPAAEPSEGE